MPDQIHNEYHHQLEFMFFFAFYAFIAKFGGVFGPSGNQLYESLSNEDQLNARYEIFDQFVEVARKHTSKRYKELCKTAEGRKKFDEIAKMFGFTKATKDVQIHDEFSHMVYMTGTPMERLVYTLRVAVANLFGDPIYPDNTHSIDVLILTTFMNVYIHKACEDDKLKMPSSLKYFKKGSWEQESKLDKLRMEFYNLVAFYNALPTISGNDDI